MRLAEFDVQRGGGELLMAQWQQELGADLEGIVVAPDGGYWMVDEYRPAIYHFAASGALIDAVTWLKPVIATQAGFVGDFFADAGDIGYLCATGDEMRETLEAVLVHPDAERYGAQVSALRAERERRTPAALAATYRGIIHAHFPWLA